MLNPADPSSKKQEAETRRLFEEKMRDAQQLKGQYENQWKINHSLANNCQESVLAHRKGVPYYAIDRISNVIITKVAVQTEQPAKPEFIPRESHRPAEYYPKSQSMIELLGPGPISEEQAQSLFQPDPNDPLGQPMATEGDFYVIDGVTSTQWLQDQYDIIWDMTHCSERVRNNIQNTATIGHQDMISQWDPDRQVFTKTNAYQYHTWIDRTAESTTDASYFIVLEPLDVEEAKTRFGLSDEQIKKYQTNQLMTLDWTGANGDKYNSLSERPMIEHYIWWQRNERVPMSVDEALRSGAVQEFETFELDPADGGVSYILNDETQAETSPGADNWPTKIGVRQVEFLGPDIIYDGPSDFPDIPVARNFNIKTNDQPYGQGEPERLAPLQSLFNRLWSIYALTSDNNSNPLKIVPASVHQEFSELTRDFFNSPHMTLPFPDHKLNALGGARNVAAAIDPGQISSVVSQMMELVIREFDILSGVGPIMRGEAKSDWSGDLAEQLTDLARGPMGFIARSTGDVLKYLGKIEAQMVVDWLEPSMAAKRSKKYPEHIHAAFQNFIGDVGFDLRVEVSGGGHRREQRETARRLMELGKTDLSPTLNKWALSQFNVPDSEKVALEMASALQPPPAAPLPEEQPPA